MTRNVIKLRKLQQMTLLWQVLPKMPRSMFLQSLHPNTWPQTRLLSTFSALSENIELEEYIQCYDLSVIVFGEGIDLNFNKHYCLL